LRGGEGGVGQSKETVSKAQRVKLLIRQNWNRYRSVQCRFPTNKKRHRKWLLIKQGFRGRANERERGEPNINDSSSDNSLRILHQA